MRMVSNSMAKTLVALAVGQALADGAIHSLDDTAARYVPELELEGTLPGAHRRFVLLGVYGQAIYVDPALKLVMVHLAVGADARADASGAHLGQERDALWRGVVARYGAW